VRDVYGFEGNSLSSVRVCICTCIRTYGDWSANKKIDYHIIEGNKSPVRYRTEFS